MKANHARANAAQTVSDRSSRPLHAGLNKFNLNKKNSVLQGTPQGTTATAHATGLTPPDAPYGAWGREAPGVGARARRAQSRAH